jgi:LmbE family N-acetylglucosaminyl deacetylase
MMPEKSSTPPRKRAAVIVAHPDDEILWCGGYILLHRNWQWQVWTLCRASDPDRAPRFRRVLEYLGAEGGMADLDDGPEQTPLAAELVEQSVLSLIPADASFDLLLTHGADGEYTRHRRHEECSRAVATLCRSGRIRTKALWCFAYDDGSGVHLPRVSEQAGIRVDLPEQIWEEKHRLITDYYGFAATSWEARVTPREEGFLSVAGAGAAANTPTTNMETS